MAYARLDAWGGLEPRFKGAPILTPGERRLVETEEAWIPGPGHEDGLRVRSRDSVRKGVKCATGSGSG